MDRGIPEGDQATGEALATDAGYIKLGSRIYLIVFKNYKIFVPDIIPNTSGRKPDTVRKSRPKMAYF